MSQALQVGLLGRSSLRHAGIICACAAGAPAAWRFAASGSQRPKTCGWFGCGARAARGEEGRAKSALAESWREIELCSGMGMGGKGLRHRAEGGGIDRPRQATGGGGKGRGTGLWGSAAPHPQTQACRRRGPWAAAAAQRCAAVCYAVLLASMQLSWRWCWGPRLLPPAFECRRLRRPRDGAADRTYCRGEEPKSKA